jgi:hypothetical protein
MPLRIASDAPTVLIRRDAFERAGLTRGGVDERFHLTPDEFRVEDELIAIGPLFGDDAVGTLVELLEQAGLTHYDDFFDLSGNWPDWLALFAMTRGRQA